MMHTCKRLLGFDALESRSLLSASPLLGGNLLGSLTSLNLQPTSSLGLLSQVTSLTGSLSPVLGQVLSTAATTVTNLGSGLNQVLASTLDPLASGVSPILSPVVTTVTQTVGNVLGTTTVIAPIVPSPIATTPIVTLPTGTLPIVTVPSIATTSVASLPTTPGTLPSLTGTLPVGTSPIVTAPAPTNTTGNATTVSITPATVTPTVSVPTQAVVTLPNGVAATLNLNTVPTIQTPAAVVVAADSADPAFIVANATAVDGFLVVPVDEGVTLAAVSPARTVAPSAEAEIVEASVTPFALLEQAMGEGVERLDQFVTSTLESLVPGRDAYGAMSWLTALAVAGLVYEVARRDLERKARARLPLPAVGMNLPEND